MVPSDDVGCCAGGCCYCCLVVTVEKQAGKTSEGDQSETWSKRTSQRNTYVPSLQSGLLPTKQQPQLLKPRMGKSSPSPPHTPNAHMIPDASIDLAFHLLPERLQDIYHHVAIAQPTLRTIFPGYYSPHISEQRRFHVEASQERVPHRRATWATGVFPGYVQYKTGPLVRIT